MAALSERLTRAWGQLRHRGAGATGSVARNNDLRLSEALARAGLVGEETLAQAAELAAKTHRNLGNTLTDMGVVSDEQVYTAWSEVVDLPVWNERGDVPEEVPFTPEFLLFNRILPVAIGEERWLIIADPDDSGLIDLLRRTVPDWRLAIHPEAELVYRLEKHFDLKREEEPEAANPQTDIEHLKDLALEAPIIRQVNDLITSGVRMGASDIHLEPFKSRIELRYRVDGVLHARPGPRIDEYSAVVSRVKILANLDIAERRLPQDGRFTIRTAGKEVDIRVSSIPTSAGEDVAMRLLDQKKQLLDLDALGMTSRIVASLRDTLRRSYGLILVTGPTGSGKTTTLYSGLRGIIDGEKKIITVEDPVEYEISGLNQIQANSDIGLTFANALRSILRHDPDVILVGEIRDKETAEIAIQAALTGHLVLSTLHTNSALGAIGRLLNMGLPDYLIANSLIAVSGQRLVRRLCPHCRKRKRIDPELARHVGVEPGTEVYAAVGCEECGDIGYRGRLPVGEYLILNAGVRQAILENPTDEALMTEARKIGFKSMLDDGLAHALGGTTTVEEVVRVVG
ncbi:MAG: Flp pilus assembly complex ATPase component TadA [Proteobacteria bacterium]|nr:Flp pilus assembly complex ATPase component TadA [Pseudomonadota bacterium]